MTLPYSRPDAAFWRGKRVLVTGHTGFKGAWLSLWLERLGALVTGASLAPATSPALFTLADGGARCSAHHVVDIRDAAAVARVVRSTRPDIVLHLAAQALVRQSYRAPLETFATNVMGTAHVLDALRGLDGVRSVVVVTTDKVYRNRESYWPYREDDALGGHDAYSASKAASEHVVVSYRDSFLAAQGVGIATARAGNVIGGGDWSLDRLIPDAVRAWQHGAILDIRRPASIRPWQHVLEPLAGYLTIAERLWHDPSAAGAYNLGPHTHEAATVRDVIELGRRAWGGGEVRYGDGDEGPHEAGWLALEVAKARTVLGVTPRWSLRDAVDRTMTWYRQHNDGASAHGLCLADIDDFERLDAPPSVPA
jgi:CDP-glucose 4,6-dehydratase